MASRTTTNTTTTRIEAKREKKSRRRKGEKERKENDGSQWDRNNNDYPQINGRRCTHCERRGRHSTAVAFWSTQRQQRDWRSAGCESVFRWVCVCLCVGVCWCVCACVCAVRRDETATPISQCDKTCGSDLRTGLATCWPSLSFCICLCVCVRVPAAPNRIRTTALTETPHYTHTHVTRQTKSECADQKATGRRRWWMKKLPTRKGGIDRKKNSQSQREWKRKKTSKKKGWGRVTEKEREREREREIEG